MAQRTADCPSGSDAFSYPSFVLSNFFDY
jgi:hypothetical protein